MELAGCRDGETDGIGVISIGTYCFYLKKEALYPNETKTGGCRMRH